MNEVRKSVQKLEKKGSNVDEKFSMETDFEKPSRNVANERLNGTKKSKASID